MLLIEGKGGNYNDCGGGHRDDDECDNNFDDDDDDDDDNDGNGGNDDSSSNGCILKTSFGTNLIGRGASRITGKSSTDHKYKYNSITFLQIRK